MRLLKPPYHGLVRADEAFRPARRERNIAIDQTVYKFNFGRRWFLRRNQKTFSTFLGRRYSGRFPLYVVQIGVFEGMDLVWQLQNTLRHPASRVTAIDPWGPALNMTSDYAEYVRKTALENLAPYAAKVHIHRGRSQDYLREAIASGRLGNLPIKIGQVDYVVIDGDHTFEGSLEDMRLTSQITKPGAWILVDDIRTGFGKRREFSDVAAATIEWMASDKSIKRVWSHRHCDCFEKI